MGISRDRGELVVRLRFGVAGLGVLCGVSSTMTSYVLIQDWASDHGYQGLWADLFPILIITWTIAGALLLFLSDLPFGFDGRRLGWALVVIGGIVTTVATTAGARGWQSGLIFAGFSLAGAVGFILAAEHAAAALIARDRGGTTESDGTSL